MSAMPQSNGTARTLLLAVKRKAQTDGAEQQTP